MTNEPRIGWEQSVERNRIDAVIDAADKLLEELTKDLDEYRKTPPATLAAVAHDLAWARGCLKDAKTVLRG